MRELPIGRSIVFMAFGSLAAVSDGATQRALLLGSVLWMLVIVFADLVRPIEQVTRGGVRPGVTPLIFLVVAFIAVAMQDVWHARGASDHLVRSVPIFALVSSAAIAAMRGLAFSRKSLGMGLMMSLGIGIAAGLVRGGSTSPCRADKCSPIGALYQGGFSHENVMGYAASLTLLVVVGLVYERQIARWVALIALPVAAVALVLSGARTSFLAVVLSVALYFAARTSSKQRIKIGLAVPVLSAVVGLYLISSAQTGDFSFRGRRWILIRESLDGVLALFGGGLSAWQDLQPAFAAQTSTHSVYGVLLVHGGLVAVVPFVLFLMTAVRQAYRTTAPHFVVVLHFVAIQAIMETIWNPASLSSRFWILIAIGLAAGSSGASLPLQTPVGDVNHLKRDNLTSVGGRDREPADWHVS